MASGSLTYAGRVQSGDAVLNRGQFKRVTRVRRAQGRKPRAGENLHLLTERDDIIKINSLEPVRVLRPHAGHVGSAEQGVCMTDRLRSAADPVS